VCESVWCLARGRHLILEHGGLFVDDFMGDYQYDLG
jgi:hypothetical protein